MKVEVQITSLEEEKIVIYCKEITEEILYFEAVDKKIFAYTKDSYYRVNQSLEQLEERYEGLGFFRCSKAMIVNLQFIAHFQSMIGNRIIATMENGEEVIISRHYAKILRQRL